MDTCRQDAIPHAMSIPFGEDQEPMPIACCPHRSWLVRFVNHRVQRYVKDCLRPSCSYCRPAWAAKNTAHLYEVFVTVHKPVYHLWGLTHEQATNLAREADRAGEIAQALAQDDGTWEIFT